MSIFACQNLTKRYGKLTALDNIDLELESGRIVGLLGPNGSGKTTLIKLANRLLQPTSGSILIDGKAPGVESKKNIAYLPDKEYLPDWMNTRQLMHFYGDFYEDFDPQRATVMLASLDIPSDMVLKKMSKGTKEKVQLILTMSRRAKVYLLDEPIAGVDPAARDYILRTIIQNYEENSLVLISTHLIADVESVLDEAVFLKQGHIVLHKPADEIRTETGKSVDEYFREVFRC
jgi:ABC-2 type transport system ATP-binding protein